MLFKSQNRLVSENITVSSPKDTQVGKVCLSNKSTNNNRAIRTLFQKEVTNVSCVISYWNGFVDGIPWEKVWLLPNRSLITNKVKEVSFKLIHRFYPAKSYIQYEFKKGYGYCC